MSNAISFENIFGSEIPVARTLLDCGAVEDNHKFAINSFVL